MAHSLERVRAECGGERIEGFTGAGRGGLPPSWRRRRTAEPEPARGAKESLKLSRDLPMASGSPTMLFPAKAAPRAALPPPSIRVDESRRPLILVTFTGVVTDDEFTAYLEAQTRVVLRPEKNVMVIDAMRAGATPPTQRKRQAEWQRQHERALAANSLGTAFAMGSAVVRGVLTAILWVQPLPHPHFVAASLADAERWAMAQILAAGLRAPVAS
jgi:hypothetical protein